MAKPLHILIVEDNEDDALLLVRELRGGGYEPAYERVDTPEAMKAALTARHWDIVVSDYLMPKFSGLAALEVLKKFGYDLPFLIVSGNIGEDIAVEAMRKGAHDYIIKGNLARLIPAIERELRDAEVRRERSSADEQLKQSRQRLFTTLENMNEGFFTLGPQWQFTFVNAEAAKIWGKNSAELLGKNLWDVAPAAVGSIFEEQYKKAVTEQVPVRFEAVSPLVNLWVEVRAHPSEGGLAVYFHDITERKNAEEKIARLNRLYAVLSRVNEAIIRVHDPATLHKEVCRITVEDGSFKMAWIGLVDPETKQVGPVASHGDDKDYLKNISIIAADVPEGQGPTGRAVFTGDHAICEDIEHDPSMRPWREKALAHGFRSSSAFPLRSGASVIGALTVYADKPRSFSDEEVGLLSSLAGDVSFALENLENERNRRETEVRINVTNALLKLFTQKFSQREYLDAACTLLRDWSGLRHVGIRIADRNSKIPFASCRGYDIAFLAQENELSLNEDRCICMRIIAGMPEDPDRVAMTENGSFLSGNTEAFVVNLAAGEREKYRGVCMRYGFKSLAVVPILHREHRIGAVHLADERENMLSRGDVAFLEHTANIIGEAIFRFGIEDDLRRNYEDLEKASERLKLSFAYNRSLIEASLDPLVTIGPEGKITDVNAATEIATGRLRQELVGTDFSDYFTDPAKARAGFEQVFSEGKVTDYALELRHRNGHIMPVLYNAALYRDEAGGVIGVFAAARDVTSLKKTEAERMRLASAVESTAEAVVITEPVSGTIQYVNPAFERITGYNKEEALGRTTHFLDSGKHKEESYRALRETLARDGVWSGQLVNKRKNGDLYYEECTMSPVRGESGEIVNYISVRRDVTEKLRLESIAESVSTMDSIGYIFSGVRHEIGNPINSINMIIGLLKAKLPTLSPEAVQDYLDRVMGQLERVEFLLRSLKSFNMFETQQPQHLRIKDFMEQFLPLVKQDFEKKGIELVLELDPRADRVHADPRALQQVLLNLLANAADAVRERERPKVSVGVFRSGGMVRIEVEDNGCGIPEDRMKDMFKPFNTTKAHGTGLGLVIVKKMLTRMNGTIDLESRRDVGTLLTISLPEGDA